MVVMIVMIVSDSPNRDLKIIKMVLTVVAAAPINVALIGTLVL